MKSHFESRHGLPALFFCFLLSCASVLSSCSSGGGPVGTGISSVEGNLVAVETEAAAPTDGVPPVLVRIEEVAGIEAETDPEGRFTLVGEFSGPVTLAFFHRGRRLAEFPLDVPAGSTVILEDLEIRPSLPRGVRARLVRERDFFGRTDLVDCEAGLLLVRDKAKRSRQFAVRVGPDTTFRLGLEGPELSCADLRPKLEILVEGVVLPDRTIEAETIVVRPGRRARL
ncbi:MAG: hypothetical protein KatS3mg076_2448 [Candidatus Binatia bacterium]|nr:MAG: hypothetical protein KatS3mg076_2448 [Candidatus Binatia bacterium]